MSFEKWTTKISHITSSTIKNLSCNEKISCPVFRMSCCCAMSIKVQSNNYVQEKTRYVFPEKTFSNFPILSQQTSCFTSWTWKLVFLSIKRITIKIVRYRNMIEDKFFNANINCFCLQNYNLELSTRPLLCKYIKSDPRSSRTGFLLFDFDFLPYGNLFH